MKNLVIIGTGGFAREVYWHAQNSVGYGNEYKFKCFIEGDVPVSKERNSLLPGPFYGTVLDYEVEDDDVFVLAIANVDAKQRIVNIIKEKGGSFIRLIHNNALVSPFAKLGEGVIITAFVTISCNTIVGDFVQYNSYSSLGHDSRVGDYSSIMAHVDITGNVDCGKYTYWGSGARALPHSKIGDNSVVGAGSVVLRNVKAGQTVFGNPAMPI